MTHNITPVATETALRKYATTILMILVVGAGGLAALFASIYSHDATTFTRWTAVLVFIALVLGAVGQFAVPLLPTRWQGAGKVSIAILTALIAFGAPFIKGSFSIETDVPLLAVGMLNIITTQLGVTVRTDDALTATKIIVTNAPVGSVQEAPENKSVDPSVPQATSPTSP